MSVSLREENRNLSIKAFIFTPAGAAAFAAAFIIFVFKGTSGLFFSLLVFLGVYKLVEPKAPDIKKDLLNKYHMNKFLKERKSYEGKAYGYRKKG